MKHCGFWWAAALQSLFCTPWKYKSSVRSPDYLTLHSHVLDFSKSEIWNQPDIWHGGPVTRLDDPSITSHMFLEVSGWPSTSWCSYGPALCWSLGLSEPFVRAVTVVFYRRLMIIEGHTTLDILGINKNLWWECGMLFFPSKDFHWNAISGFQHCSFTPPGVINMAMDNSRMIFPANWTSI